jgi:hypothetical protein
MSLGLLLASMAGLLCFGFAWWECRGGLIQVLPRQSVHISTAVVTFEGYKGSATMLHDLTMQSIKLWILRMMIVVGTGLLNCLAAVWVLYPHLQTVRIGCALTLFVLVWVHWRFWRLHRRLHRGDVRSSAKQK